MTLTRRGLGSAASALLLAAGLPGRPRAAEGPIKIGVLHSLSGTMAISETILKDFLLMQVSRA